MHGSHITCIQSNGDLRNANFAHKIIEVESQGGLNQLVLFKKDILKIVQKEVGLVCNEDLIKLQ